jgi:hypothetical protein
MVIFSIMSGIVGAVMIASSTLVILLLRDLNPPEASDRGGGRGHDRCGDGTADSWQGYTYGKLCGGADGDMGGQRERGSAASTGAIAFWGDYRRHSERNDTTIRAHRVRPRTILEMRRVRGGRLEPRARCPRQPSRSEYDA